MVKSASEEIAELAGIPVGEARRLLTNTDPDTVKIHLFNRILGDVGEAEDGGGEPGEEEEGGEGGGRGGEGAWAPAAPAAEAAEAQVECPICFTAAEVHEAAFLECGHVFCSDCARKYLEAEAEQGKVAFVCPLGECRQEMLQTEVGRGRTCLDCGESCAGQSCSQEGGGCQ